MIYIERNSEYQILNERENFENRKICWSTVSVFPATDIISTSHPLLVTPALALAPFQSVQLKLASS